MLEHHGQQNELPIALVDFAVISFSGFILPVSGSLLPAPNPCLTHPQIAPSLLVATFSWSATTFLFYTGLTCYCCGLSLPRPLAIMSLTLLIDRVEIEEDTCLSLWLSQPLNSTSTMTASIC